ncbi:AP-5 complex subunit beta-1-like isoform X1 [Dendronephthya gigantea]|uniref:AP-5 complex subunit beta-1-like isoform X1 n=1 Tax=Dendronephthya gigantea TaxID=151771 RepID=UPI00106BE762|nr:AP-5 complex subunit beta-1-like isoform X1 [Dendronephthya gigantea]
MIQSRLMDIDLDNAQDIETFLFDTLDLLCQEKTSEIIKLKLLAALQEKVEWTSLDVTSAEHVTGSLKNMYSYPGENDGQFYKSQLLVTLTMVLILSSSKLKNLQENCETLHSSIQFLTDVISKINDSSSVLTRKTACECLWEIEISYPGLLQDRLGLFFELCEKELSVIFQSYMILFVTTLKNAIVHISTFRNDIPEDQNYLNELLFGEADLSMKMNSLAEQGQVIEDQFPLVANIVGGHHFDKSLPTKFKNKEIKRAASFIAENYNLLTGIPLFHVLLQLMHCIKLTSLSSSVFKSQFVKSLSNTVDLPLFQLVLLLKSTFRNQLFEDTDTVILLQRLCHLSNQRVLGNSQRLLCYDWLINFPHDVKAQHERKYSFLAECLDFTEKAKFHPTVFDPLELIPGKLDVLSCCYIPGDGPDIATATLMNCLVCLEKPIKHGLKRPHAVLLFQVLFAYYSRHRESVALVQEIYRYLLSIATEQPHLVPYVLNITMSISQLTPESYLPSEILRNFTDYIVALPLRKQIRNIQNFLKVFEYAMRLKDIPPKGTVEYLTQLATFDEIRKNSGNWSVGNAILHVCRNILQYHDTSKIIAELGECLLTINKTNQDIDICDRAMFYYTLLTTISTKKCARLLTGTLTNLGKTNHPLDKPGEETFSSQCNSPLCSRNVAMHQPPKILVPPEKTRCINVGQPACVFAENLCHAHAYRLGSSFCRTISLTAEALLCTIGLAAASLPLTAPIAKINEPFLNLTSGAGRARWSDCYWEDDDSSGFENIQEYFSSYLKQVENMAEHMSITIPLYLHYVVEPSEDVPEAIFAVVLQLQTSSNYKTIQDIHVPYLSYKKSYEPTEGCQIVEVTFSPIEPEAASFNVRVIFSNASGRSYIMALKPIVVEFHDLFIPLRHSENSLSKPELGFTFSPEQMFDTLWQHIEEHQYSRKNQSFSGAKSIVYLDLERNKVEAILEKLDNHIIKRDEVETSVGVFLPPHHHFLLRFVIHPAHCVVHVATDKWQILASLEEFLKHGRTINIDSASSPIS